MTRNSVNGIHTLNSTSRFLRAQIVFSESELLDLDFTSQEVPCQAPLAQPDNCADKISSVLSILEFLVPVCAFAPQLLLRISSRMNKISAANFRQS